MTSHLRALASRVGVVMVLGLGPAIVMTAAPARASIPPSSATVATYEARVIYRMNVERVKYHRNKVVGSSCPDRYAESWGAYLGRTGSFYHRSMTSFLSGCNATRVAENLARGGVSADRIVAMWMASPGHRANILDSRLTRVGVAAVYTGGQWTVVADFTRP